MNNLVEGITLLNAVTKCGGIEPGEDPKHAFEQRTAGITKIYQSRARGIVDSADEPIGQVVEPAKQVDFGGYIWFTYAEPVRGYSSLQAVQARMAYALAVDDFNSYLEEGGAEWRVEPRVEPYRHSVLEALVAVQSET